MRKVTFCLVVLGVLALAFISMPMRAQNQSQGYPSPDYPFPGYPPEFAPSRTSRALPTPDLTAPPKFKKFAHSVPNQYIVVLNDDAVSQARTHVERRALVANLAKELAPGAVRIPYVWADALNGFCVELPNEAAAIALSQNPQVKYVESNGLGSLTNTDAPEWLDRLDQLNLPLDHSFTPNRTGAGVTVYDVGTGVNINHTEFGGRAFIADDEVAKNSQPPECAVDTCTWKSATDNDCDGHGTAMLGLIGGTTYGVAKSATLGSAKVTYPSNGTRCFEYAWIVAGINWVTAHHNDHPTQLEVANCSFETVPNIPDIQYPNPDPDAIRNAVVGSMNSGVSYTIAVGNENQSLDNPQTQRKTPRDVMDLEDGRKGALLVGAENQETDYRLVVYKADGTIASGSTYGSKLSLFSPGYRVTSASSESNIATNINDS